MKSKMILVTKGNVTKQIPEHQEKDYARLGWTVVNNSNPYLNMGNSTYNIKK